MATFPGGLRRCCWWALCLVACGGRAGEDATGVDGSGMGGSGVGGSGVGGSELGGTGGDSDPPSSSGDASIATATGGMSMISVERVIGSPCGNNRLDAFEACDDGNNRVGDGCSATCQLEDPVCLPTNCLLSSVCGDGRRDSNEVCDDANITSLDGCDAACNKQEDGWLCPMPGRPCTTICGDEKVVGPEECDVGALNGIYVANRGEGCSRDCRIVPSCLLEAAPAPCPELCNASSNRPAYCGGICGDGRKDWNEQCDLGPGNGSSPTAPCTASCKYGPFCGDGILDPGLGEECDLGTLNAGPYGIQGACTRDCRAAHYCGDGFVDTQFGEDCDVGSMGNGQAVFAGCVRSACRIWLP